MSAAPESTAPDPAVAPRPGTQPERQPGAQPEDRRETALAGPLRVRFAPSPTGFLHVGGARTAIYNDLLRQSLGGAFVLRIEDTDRARSDEAMTRGIEEALRWVGVEWDEGPFLQSERLPRHLERAGELLAAGKAYRCFCTPEQLEPLRREAEKQGRTFRYPRTCAAIPPAEAAARQAAGEPAAVRFRMPDGAVRFVDLVRGEVVFDHEVLDDFVLLRSDGTPTYHMSVVVDDVDMGITLVLRGEDHLSNTPKHVRLFEAFGAPLPRFGHLSLILGPDKKKLSKRTGDTALQDYRDKGYPPEAVLNFLALQGWALDDKTTIFPVDELIRRFDPSDVSPSGSIFDPDKFLWMAGEYVRADDVGRLAERCAPFMIRAGWMSAEEIRDRAEWYRAAIALEKDRIRLYSELPERLAYLFAADDEVAYQDDALRAATKHADRARILEEYVAWLAPRIEKGAIDPGPLREATRAWIAEKGLSMPAFFQPLRCALTGAGGGADLFEVMRLLGPSRVLRRIRRAVERLAG